MKNETIIVYSKDGDLANALVLFASNPKALLLKTDDASRFKDQGAKIIQVGGFAVKGATHILAGKDRVETLNKVNEFVKK